MIATADTRLEKADASVGTSSPNALISDEALRGFAARENFPVVHRLLPSRPREALIALYDFARLVDEIGDTVAGDRLALLDGLEGELKALGRGRAQHPVLRRLGPVMRAYGIPEALPARLIEANRRDQGRVDLRDRAALLRYCHLSADPVGELVLHVFARHDAPNVALSDAICSGLQIVEHCQDVAEDLRAGRIYLPREDREAAGCRPEDLSSTPASPSLRRLIEGQVRWARSLFAEGAPLLGRLGAMGRITVAGYLAGGLAACDALEDAGFDPNSSAVRPRKRRMTRHMTGLLLGWRPRA